MEEVDSEWLCTRTDNGEWISEIHVEVLKDYECRLLKGLAFRRGEILEVNQFYYDNGEMYFWCYKKDIKDFYSILNRIRRLYPVDY